MVLQQNNYGFSVIRIWCDLALSLRANLAPLLRASIIPTVFITALDLANLQSGVVGRTLIEMSAWVFAGMFAVSTHRIILLGRSSLPNAWGVYINPIVLVYILYTFLIGVLIIPAVLVPLLIIFPWIVLPSQATLDALRLSLFIPFFYLLARFSIVLPARAIEERIGILDALRLTAGNGWKLVLATILPSGLVYLLFVQLDSIFLHSSNWLFAPLYALSLLITTAISVASLSCAYRELKRALDFEHRQPPIEDGSV